MTLAGCLCGLWAAGCAAGLWPGLLARLGVGWPQAALAALAVPVLARFGSAHGPSVGTVLWPLVAGAALGARLGPAERARALEAALLGGLVLVLGRAFAQGATSVPAALAAGLTAGLVAGNERAAAAGALLGLSVIPAVLSARGAGAVPAAGAADDLAAGVAVAVIGGLATASVGRRFRTERRVRL